MKKILLILLIATLSISLTACGEKQDTATAPAPTPSIEASTPTVDASAPTPVEDAPADTHDFEAIKEDGSAAFDTFLAVASQMEDNSDFETVRTYYANKADDMARQYAEYCGGTEDDFLALTTFEQFLWFELYINPLKYTTKGQYDTYFSDLGRFQATITERCYSLLSRMGDSGQEIADAYQEIMAWQYNLFAERGFMYSFMTGETSIEASSTETN